MSVFCPHGKVFWQDISGLCKILRGNVNYPQQYKLTLGEMAMCLLSYLSPNIFPCTPYIPTLRNYRVLLEEALFFQVWGGVLHVFFLIWIAPALANSHPSFRTQCRDQLSLGAFFDASFCLSFCYVLSVLIAPAHGSAILPHIHFLICLSHQTVSSLESGNVSFIFISNT